MEIKTNNTWRQFIYGCDVPVKVLENEFDHLSEDDKVNIKAITITCRTLWQRAMLKTGKGIAVKRLFQAFC